MSVARESWPQPRGRLRERPRAVAASAAVGLLLVAGSFGLGVAASSGGSDGQDAAKVRQLKGTLVQQSQMAQASAGSLRTQNARLARRVTIQRTRAISWKRRYLTLRRSRSRRR